MQEGEDAGEWVAACEGGVVLGDFGLEFGDGEGERCAGDETFVTLGLISYSLRSHYLHMEALRFYPYSVEEL